MSALSNSSLNPRPKSAATVASLVCWLLFAFSPLLQSNAGEFPPPNILWITSEDNGPELGCYGDSFATTPNIDALSTRAVRYEHCWSNAPVCAPARTTIISGRYATSFGASNMRSRSRLPAETKILPELMREAGYYTSNNSKEDYNFVQERDYWDDSSNRAHWRNRPDGKPFFAVFNLTMTHESQIRKRPHAPKHSAKDVPIPPYHPDLPEVRADWAQYYDKIEEMDTRLGDILAELAADGLESSTIVFYLGDHGSGMPRSKRWLYNSGLRVPLIVHIPEAYSDLKSDDYLEGGKSDRLVSFVDLVPTVLNLAGRSLPGYLEGRPFLGTETTAPHTHLFGFRDRMDERIDMSRAVRTERYLYVKNFYPDRAQGTYLTYMYQTPTTQVWQRAFSKGELNGVQSSFFRAKAEEELYDLDSDPFQVDNLSGSTEHAATLASLRNELRRIMIETRDHGVIPESVLKPEIESQGKPFEGWDWSRLVDAAFAGSSTESSVKLSDALSEVETEVIEFWDARNCLLKVKNSPEAHPREIERLRELFLQGTTASRIVAAEGIAGSSSDPQSRIAFRLDESQNALEWLLKASDFRTFGVLHGVAALNAMAEIPRAELDRDGLKSLPDMPAHVEGVYQGLISRLVEQLTSQE